MPLLRSSTKRRSGSCLLILGPNASPHHVEKIAEQGVAVLSGARVDGIDRARHEFARCWCDQTAAGKSVPWVPPRLLERLSNELINNRRCKRS